MRGSGRERMAGTVAAMRGRPRALAALAALLVAAGLVLGPAREVLAYTFNTGYDTRACCFRRDSDGRVSEREGRLNGDAPPSTRELHTLGRAIPWKFSYSNNTTKWDVRLTYDWRETEYCNIYRGTVYAHERAHARGWDHGKGNPTINKAYYASGTCFPDGTGGRSGTGKGTISFH